MAKFHLVLLIHAHQPVGNFEEVFERAYAASYRPFVELLLRHPAIRVGLHYSGPLLEWMEQAHPEFFDWLREMVDRGQAELVGGGFYEPILISIPPADRVEQLKRLADYIEERFGRRPTGAWLAERVWEPQLPAALAQAGVRYTLVDDSHFLASGLAPPQLHGYYLAEELGSMVKVIPGLQALRYLIPYRSPEESIGFLRSAAEQHPGGMAAMGDDCEKFGVWPGTYEHCYTNRWLERFFQVLEANAEWLELSTPGDCVEVHAPLGRAALPTASYREMMEWALPTAARQRFSELEREFSSRPDVLAFFHGATWRNFLAKYSEVNLLHKKMLRVSEKLARLSASRRRGATFRRDLAVARGHLLRAQCNDAYWHGIFGGLYAPHLRTVLWRELIRAEKLLGSAEHGRRRYGELERFDFDSDGREELFLASERFAAVVKPSDGGTLAALDFRPADVTLINSLERRPEAYHAKLRNIAAQASGGVVSIHDQARVKEPGLAERLRYDRWARHAFRLLLFASGKHYEDYAALRLEEDSACAGGAFRVVEASPSSVHLALEEEETPLGGAPSARRSWRCSKTLTFRPSRRGFEVECSLLVSPLDPDAAQFQAGLEVVLNFLAPNEPNRYFEVGGERHSLNWGGAVPASRLRIVDESQNVATVLQAPGAREFWVAPIETISQSEEGFERVYQGSQILTVWPMGLDAAGVWAAQLVLGISLVR